MGDSAVNDAMIVAERHVKHRTDGNRIVDHHRPFLDRSKAENSYVRLTDHRQPEKSAEDAGISDRKCPFLHFFRSELLRPRTLGKIIQVALNAENILFIGVLYHRHDEAP